MLWAGERLVAEVSRGDEHDNGGGREETGATGEKRNEGKKNAKKKNAV